MTTTTTRKPLGLDLDSLTDDGDTLEFDNGRILRLRIEVDQDYDPFDECDFYGKVEPTDRSRNRPKGFNGNAEVLWPPQNSGSYWWQPPADMQRTSEHFDSLRDLVCDLLAFGGKMVTLELLDGRDAYGKPIVTSFAHLGGIDSLDDGYLKEVVGELVYELTF